MSSAAYLDAGALRLSAATAIVAPLPADKAQTGDVIISSGYSAAVPDAFLADILKPYRPNARYLKSAAIDAVSRGSLAPRCPFSKRLLSGTGRFAIGDSCYIDDTGHFNAVEFNICYNQLAYVLFGKCIESRHVPELGFLDIAEFKQQQLPNWLIVGIEDVRFTHQLCRRDFTAVLSVDRVLTVRSTRFFFTTIAFADREGVKASGAVTLAYSGPSGGADR